MGVKIDVHQWSSSNVFSDPNRSSPFKSIKPHGSLNGRPRRWLFFCFSGGAARQKCFYPRHYLAAIITGKARRHQYKGIAREKPLVENLPPRKSAATQIPGKAEKLHPLF